MDGLQLTTRVITAAGAVTVASTDVVIVVNKTVGAATTVNLAGSPAFGATLTVKDGKGDAATNNITLTPAAGNIDGAGTLVMATNYQSMDLIYNGTQWNVLANSASGGGGGGSPGGSSNQVQYNNSGSFGGLSKATVNADGTLNILPEVIAVSGTTKTLALTDANSIQDCSNAAAQTVTIPLNASVAFPVNSVIQFEQNGAGTLTVVGVNGVTVNGTNAGSFTSNSQYSAFYLRQESTDVWYLESANSFGQNINSNIPSGSAVGLSSASPANVTSISLPPGNWLVYGNVAFTAGALTTATVFSGGINTTSATLPTAPGAGAFVQLGISVGAGATEPCLPTGMTSLSLTATTMVYLVAQATFAASTMSVYGFIGAQRIGD